MLKSKSLTMPQEEAEILVLCIFNPSIPVAWKHVLYPHQTIKHPKIHSWTWKISLIKLYAYVLAVGLHPKVSLHKCVERKLSKGCRQNFRVWIVIEMHFDFVFILFNIPCVLPLEKIYQKFLFIKCHLNHIACLKLTSA